MSIYTCGMDSEQNAFKQETPNALRIFTFHIKINDLKRFSFGFDDERKTQKCIVSCVCVVNELKEEKFIEWIIVFT